MSATWRVAALLGLLAATATPPLAAQRPLRGVIYDSLLHAPLGGAELWVRGTELRTITGDDGSFRFDAVPVGRHVILVSHPGLDSAGLYNVALPLSVAAGEGTPADVTLATPSLASLWRHRCGMELGAVSDSGLVFGVIQDAATGARLAGAGLIVAWIQLGRLDNANVQMDGREVRTRADSVGNYYACGVAPDMTLGLRAYAGRDSTGLIDVRLGPRAVGRQDLTISLPPPRPPAALRGKVETSDGAPLLGARVSVREAGTAVMYPDGAFLLTGLPAGTQWVSVQAIGRSPVEQAMDFRGGDTAFLSVALGPLPVTLDPVRVMGQRSRLMTEFEERRRGGQGYTRTEAELAQIESMRGVFTGLPSVRLGRTRATADFVVFLPSPSAGGRGFCTAALFIDGFRSSYDQLNAYEPSDLLGVELYPRPSSAPIQYQNVATGCGVILVWTKYLK